MQTLTKYFFILFCLVSVLGAKAQGLQTPQESPKAILTQTVGVSEISITYNRPAIKGRKVWGELVPYKEVWRAGANENTIISFSHPVKIEGKQLPAGKYGLHMIPEETQWTIIFSKNSTSWGSYSYLDSEDALRVTVTPAATAEIRENLAYEVNNIKGGAATVSLIWEKMNVPFNVEFDTKAIVLENIRTSFLRGTAKFGWQGWNTAAQYCLTNNVNLEEALTWSDKSIAMNENFANLSIKSKILAKSGKQADADTYMAKAIPLANEQQLNNYAYELLRGGNNAKAIELFLLNAKNNPNSWNVHDSLGEAYAKAGDKKNAVKSYQKAMSMTKDDKAKQRLEESIKKINS
jgi:tetratricopeptide (TPR) repeat protein